MIQFGPGFGSSPSQTAVVREKRSPPLLLPVARLALSMRLHFLDQLAKLNRKKWLNQ